MPVTTPEARAGLAALDGMAARFGLALGVSLSCWGALADLAARDGHR